MKPIKGLFSYVLTSVGKCSIIAHNNGQGDHTMFFSTFVVWWLGHNIKMHTYSALFTSQNPLQIQPQTNVKGINHKSWNPPFIRIM